MLRRPQARGASPATGATSLDPGRARLGRSAPPAFRSSRGLRAERAPRQRPACSPPSPARGSCGCLGWRLGTPALEASPAAASSHLGDLEAKFLSFSAPVSKSLTRRSRSESRSRAVVGTD